MGFAFLSLSQLRKKYMISTKIDITNVAISKYSCMGFLLTKLSFTFKTTYYYTSMNCIFIVASPLRNEDLVSYIQMTELEKCARISMKFEK